MRVAVVGAGVVGLSATAELLERGAEVVCYERADAPMAGRSAGWNFEIEDATPEIPLNQAIWKSIHGRDARAPAPKHDYIVGSMPIED